MRVDRERYPGNPRRFSGVWGLNGDSAAEGVSRIRRRRPGLATRRCGRVRGAFRLRGPRRPAKNRAVSGLPGSKLTLVVFDDLRTDASADIVGTFWRRSTSRASSPADGRLDRDRGLPVLPRHPVRDRPLKALLGRRHGRSAPAARVRVDPRAQRRGGQGPPQASAQQTTAAEQPVDQQVVETRPYLAVDARQEADPVAETTGRLPGRRVLYSRCGARRTRAARQRCGQRDRRG